MNRLPILRCFHAGRMRPGVIIDSFCAGVVTIQVSDFPKQANQDLLREVKG